MGYKVYYLSDPRVGKPRYYGVTASPLKKRLQNHYGINRYNPGHPKEVWIYELKSEGIRVDITLIAEYEDREIAIKLETSLITNGGDLLNIIAGDGYKNPKFRNRYLIQSIVSDKRKMRRKNKYGNWPSIKEDKKEEKIKAPKDIKLTKNKPGRPRKEKKQKRELNLTPQQIESRLANLRPYWFTKRVV